MSGNIVDFSEAANRAWREEFKKRWKDKGSAGLYTDDIWAWEDMLKDNGWIVQLYDTVMQESATFVNFDKKLLTNNNRKAFHTQKAMSAILDKLFAGNATGRWLFYWEEVNDEAHRHVRDGDEYKGSDDYMTEWYSMELYSRQMGADEDIPLGPVSEKTELLLESADVPV